MNFNHDYPLPVYKQEASEKYFNVEAECMAAEGYSESKEAILRKIAVRVIFNNSKSDKFDPFVPYLAVNFFDRFISRHQLPNVLGRVRDDLVLAANCCLTMAWKMRDHCFSLSEFLAKRNLKKQYEEHILKMELQVLRGLTWQMRAVTPISFLRFFVEMIPVGKSIKRRSLNEIIIQTQGDIRFTTFRPSVIAASALLIACRFLYHEQYGRSKKILLDSVGKYVAEDLEACLKKIYDMCIEKKIPLERDVGFKDSRQSNVGAGETSSSIAQRPGKEPMVEAEAEDDEAESKIDPEMNFELRWMMWSSEDPEEWTIDSPTFRTPAPIEDPVDDERAEARNFLNLFASCRSCTIL